MNRVELKDYLDIAALLQSGMPLAHMLGCTNAVYRGEFPVTACLKSLACFDVTELPELPESQRLILEKAATQVHAIQKIDALTSLIGTV